MMLYLVGLGLGDEKDIKLKGLRQSKKCSKVYMEAYTSLLSFGLSASGNSTLENLYGKSIIVAFKEVVEEKADDMLLEAQSSDVAFLVVGDPFWECVTDVLRDKTIILVTHKVDFLHNVDQILVMRDGIF